MSQRTSTFVPISLLCVFTDGKEYYIEQSSLSNENWVGAWQPLNEQFVRKVFENFKVNTDRIRFGGYIPPNVIGYSEKIDHNLIMWRTEVQTVTMLFDPKTKIPNGKYIVPGLVWVFGNSLDLYAYIEWEGEKTELYHAPFYNVSKENVCLGTAAEYIEDNRKNMYSFRDIMRIVERSFWHSKFTHAGSTDNINGAFPALFEKTKDATKYPYEYLVATELTVNDIANEIFNT